MRTNIFLRYCVIVAVIVLAWWFARNIHPALITLVGLCIIVGSTIWLVASIARKPKDIVENAKSAWRSIWDAFWGL
jgi:hypothetical protein